MKRTPLRRKTGLKRKSRLKPMSDKKRADNELYAIAKVEWRAERVEADGYLRCQHIWKKGDPEPLGTVILDDEGRCLGNGMDSPHHIKHRTGPLLYDKRWFGAACFLHHRLYHDNQTWAKKRRYLIETKSS